MINIRFHIVSLVAVFLALGVGVTMGSSFIDRVTVESMQGRVDDLESGFRERGDRLAAYRDMVARSDEAASSLTDSDSRAIDGVLVDQQVVVVLPTGSPDGTAEELVDVVTNGAANVVGTVELQPGLAPGALDGELSREDLGVLRGALGDELLSAATSDADDDLEELARSSLATAFAVLSADPPPPGAQTEPGSGVGTTQGESDASSGETEQPETGDVADSGTDSSVSAPDEDGARALIDRFSEAGLLAIDGAGQPIESAFPATAGVRYIVVVAADTQPSSQGWTVPFVEDYSAAAPATMLIAAVGANRAVGDLPPSSQNDADLAALLEPLRSGAASDVVTTVESATEPLGLLAVAYGLAAQLDGIVGHYGIGEGATAPYPPAAQE